MELAGAAGARRLALTHRDPSHNDAKLVQIEERARKLAKSRNYDLEVFRAYEGCEVASRPQKAKTAKSGK